MSVIESLVEQLASATVNETTEEKVVSFAGCQLKLDTEDDAEPIVAAISSCPGMTTLRLEGNTIGIPGAKSISKALETQTSFRRALWKDMFTRRTVDEIPQALNFLSNGVMLANAKLVELDLSDNAFGPRGLIGIVKLLESSSCYTLQELHLNNNGLGIQGAKMLAEALCKLVENSCKDGSPLSLKIFVCGRNRLENEGASAISNFFKILGSLESVAMPQNGIYSPGIKNLADAFMSNPKLKVINLEDNSLTEEGAKCIAKCLPSLENINMLNFGDCLIRTEGAFALAESLKDCCPQLRELYLGFNEINKEGGKAIIDAMTNKENLDLLVLNGNNFGEEGCQMIQKKVAELGLLDVLSTLSEDEGDDNEDEEGDDDNDDDDDDEYENVDDEDSDSANEFNKSVEIINNKAYNSPMSKSTAKDFILNPSSTALISLYKAKEDLLSVLPQEPSVNDYLELFKKICMVVKLEDEAAKLAACSYSDEILSRTIKLCSNNMAEFNNSLLVCLGLLKGEDKKPAKGTDITGALLILQHAAMQSYFHYSTKNILQFFSLQAFKLCYGMRENQTFIDANIVSDVKKILNYP